MLDLKIFKTNRIGLTQLYEDAMNYVKETYNANGQTFSMASPFAQIINVVVNLGRMILFYIETSVTELNIETAYQSRSIKGISQLTGHDISRGMAARGTLHMSNMMTSDYQGQTIYIKNYTKINNSANGLSYIAVFPTNVLALTVGAFDSDVEIPIIQGEVKYQQGTGTGEILQSFNFGEKTDAIVDNFFVNIYVNGKRWENVKSIFDMTYNQEACIVKSSLNGGVDVFFGTGNNGKIPEIGSTVLCEYIVCQGAAGNISSDDVNNYWEFADDGYDVNDDVVDLNSIYKLSTASDIIFGTYGESIEMTRKFAPHASRSYVLATPISYKTFLSRLNMFSTIDAYSGFRTNSDQILAAAYETKSTAYQKALRNYNALINEGKEPTAEETAELNLRKSELEKARVDLDNAKTDDNVVYLYLIPDINKRISSPDNYFTCSIDRFRLTDDEKTGILNLIEDSGQRMLTLENKIIDPKFAKFAINAFVQIWSTYSFDSVKSAIVTAVSDYVTGNLRRDRIPVSDIIRVIESVDGVDSVNVFFDADRDNSAYFGDGNYGIDEYGDIVLKRTVFDAFGNRVEVNDLQPIFRGDFTSPNGVYYEDTLDGMLGPLNITLKGKSVVEK